MKFLFNFSLNYFSVCFREKAETFILTFFFNFFSLKVFTFLIFKFYNSFFASANNILNFYLFLLTLDERGFIRVKSLIKLHDWCQFSRQQVVISETKNVTCP